MDREGVEDVAPLIHLDRADLDDLPPQSLLHPVVVEGVGMVANVPFQIKNDQIALRHDSAALPLFLLQDKAFDRFGDAVVVVVGGGDVVGGGLDGAGGVGHGDPYPRIADH